MKFYFHERVLATLMKFTILRSSIFILFSVDTCTVPGVPSSDQSSQSAITYNTAVTYTCSNGYSNTRGQLTVSHFSYAPLIKCKITRKRNLIIFILRLLT